MSIIKDFLFQLTLMVIPIFSYFMIVTEKIKSDRNRKIIMAVLWGISILCCMTYPVYFGQNARLDLRIIPLLFGSLYGGFWTSLFLSALIILYRLSFGISLGFYNTVLVLLFALPALLYFQKSFAAAKKDKRIKIAVGLSLYYSLIGSVLFGLLRGFSINDLQVQLIYLVFAVGSAWFLTVLYETVREIHQLRSEMLNAEKLRVISELASVFAHEIRNPMQVTRGFLQLLHEPDLPDKKREYLQISIEELDRANEIINDFLAFGKPLMDTSVRMNAGLQLQRAINILQSYSLTHNVEMKTDIPDHCWIYANPQKLNQSFINILKNAIESMPDGGIVVVTCSAEDDEKIRIVIKDYGIGMTQEQIDRLGSPFYSLKENGTGLGMMVSFQIVRSFKGKISVFSEKGSGTEIVILLPKVESS
ncbi:ATP-binding protein [Metabacillus sp. 84]|uniref:ATP-binding protein n=1 Tax=unclassified Metabacillus TaxID=2675274 RepID=UPI003CE7D24C